MEYKLKVNIKEEVLDKIKTITYELKDEFAGFLFGEVKGGIITINDIQFPKQQVTGGSVDLDMPSVLEMRKNNPNWDKLLGLWHSHGNLSAFFSAGEGDESHIKFISNGKDLTLFIVTSYLNNTFSYKCRVELKKPIHLTIDDVEMYVNRNGKNNKFIEEIKKLIIPTKQAEITYNNKSEETQYLFSPKTRELIVCNLTYMESMDVKSIPNITYKTSYIEDGRWYVIFPCKDNKEAKIMVEDIKVWLSSKNNMLQQKGLNYYAGYDY